ncbi:MAG: phosphate acyltransferase PlsX [candidate division WOR-3 bacterium]|nr:phosphate acyltransferase PlsX [candidate division WOR-3 bacterium]
MKIGFDLMGSDNSPHIEIEALKFIKDEIKSEIIVVGKGDYEKEVKNLGFEYRIAEEVIGMHEIPTVAVRQKRNSSLGVLFSMLQKKEIDGLVSAGNTGAIMGFSFFDLGTIEENARPGLAITLPTQSGYSIMIDVGANIKPKPPDLLYYGIMGSVLAKIILKKENPRVGLLNVGSESVKGDEIRQKAYQLLKEGIPDFVGNIEGNNLMKGFVDVIVTDGFTGNVLLKYAEGIVDALWNMLKETVDAAMRRKFGQFLVKPAMKDLKAKFSYEEYGGGILLGVNGVVIICHGHSSPLALKNALLMARCCVECNIIEEIKKVMKK